MATTVGSALFDEDPWRVETVALDDSDTASLLRLYFVEVVGRYIGRAPSREQVDAAMAEDPSTALAWPTGCSCSPATAVHPPVAPV